MHVELCRCELKPDALVISDCIYNAKPTTTLQRLGTCDATGPLRHGKSKMANELSVR